MPRSASGRLPRIPKPKRGISLKTREFWRAGFEKGVRKPLVTPEFADAYPYSDDERATIEALRRKAIVGTGEQVAERLFDLARRFDLDEIVVVTWTHDPAARHRSYELLSRAVIP